MTIDRIDVTITTASAALSLNAGTDGLVYLGFGGREFRCFTHSRNFRRGTTDTFTFGESANISNPAANDPRHPVIEIPYMDLFPVYLRFDQDESDHWLLQHVAMSLNEVALYESRLGPEGLWMGRDTGTFYHVPRRDPHHH